VPPAAGLEGFIDFFWETKFDDLLKIHPKGFSDALFPNIGYTYLINLGTPFIMQVDDKKFNMKTDGFLPRNKSIECYHRQGNKLFGIKFKISPIIFTTKVNFAEYREYIYPLSYLMEQAVIDKVKKAASFEERIKTLNDYFLSIIKTYSGSWEPIRIVSEILQHCDTKNDFTSSVESFAEQYKISPRTLHRYFETTTCLSSKKALQVLRIRKAVQQLANAPADFNFEKYGYYDYSHFSKHLQQFLRKDTIIGLKPHLRLLQQMNITK
jgi:AraC-like DNA-binding protein